MCSNAADHTLRALDAALDALASEQAAVGDAARLDRVRRLTVAANRITALQAAAVRDAESHQSAEHDGLKSMRSWLRTHTRLSGAAVTGLVPPSRDTALVPEVCRSCWR